MDTALVCLEPYSVILGCPYAMPTGRWLKSGGHFITPSNPGRASLDAPTLRQRVAFDRGQAGPKRTRSDCAQRNHPLRRMLGATSTATKPGQNTQVVSGAFWSSGLCLVLIPGMAQRRISTPRSLFVPAPRLGLLLAMRRSLGKHHQQLLLVDQRLLAMA